MYNSIPKEYLVIDNRNLKDFKTKTFNGYKKSQVFNEMQKNCNCLCILILLLIFVFLGSNEKKPDDKPATPLLEKYSEKITVSFGSAKEEKGKEPVKTTGPKEVSKPPEKDVEMIDLEPDKTKTNKPMWGSIG